MLLFFAGILGPGPFQNYWWMRVVRMDYFLLLLNVLSLFSDVVSHPALSVLSILTTYLFERVWEIHRDRERTSVTKYKCFKCVLDKNWEDGLRRFTGCWLFMLFVCNSNAKCLLLCQNKNDIYIFTGFRFTKFELDRYLSLFIQSSNYSNLSRGSQRRRLFLEIFSSRELSEKKVLCFIYCLQRNFNWIQMA